MNIAKRRYCRLMASMKWRRGDRSFAAVVVAQTMLKAISTIAICFSRL